MNPNSAFQVVRRVLNAKRQKECHQFIQKHQFQKKAGEIHGEYRYMQKLIPNYAKWAHEIADKVWMELKMENCPFTQLHDCSIIFVKPGAAAQSWHMDALNKFLVVNVLVNSDNGTEFLDLPYAVREQNIADRFDYPSNWILGSKNQFVKPSVAVGDAIVFWSNVIHRGPSTMEEKNTRISLYLTFKKPRQSVTTDFAYPNWAWFDARFAGPNKPNRRGSQEIEFLRNNQEYLELFPDSWFEIDVYGSVTRQVKEREQQALTFPECLNLVDVKWPKTDKFYLCQYSITEKGEFALRYFATADFPRESWEYLSPAEFRKLEKKFITNDNWCQLDIAGCQVGKSTAEELKQRHPKSVSRTIQCYPFSSRILLKEPGSWDILFLTPLYLGPKDVFIADKNLLQVCTHHPTSFDNQ